jgi:2'-5' RNA ligase
VVEWKIQEDEFNQVWEKRRNPPIIESGVENGWSKGRINYLTFLIRIKNIDIIKKIQRIQTDLSKFPCIDPFPPQYFHITVKGTGCFLVNERKNPDEYTKDEIPELLDKAEKVFEDTKPFNVYLKNLNDFVAAIVIEAHDGGVIREINTKLIELPGVLTMDHDGSQFLPHMSICQFKSTERYFELISRLEEIREQDLGRIMVDSIELINARAFEGRYPVFSSMKEFRLGS